MSYSATTASTLWPTANPVVVGTRFAHSDDAGATWQDAGLSVNAWTDVTIPLASPNNTGSWNHETSSLVYDPGAAAGERWKLFWYHILELNGVNHPEHSWIAYKAADTAEHLATATEIKLFSSAFYDTSNNSTSGGSRSPVGGAPKIAIDTAFGSSLNGCAVVEPALYADQTALYAAFGCVKVEADQSSSHSIFVMKCASPCNVTSASSWQLLGTALSKADSDARQEGYGHGRQLQRDVYLCARSQRRRRNFWRAFPERDRNVQVVRQRRQPLSYRALLAAGAPCARLFREDALIRMPGRRRLRTMPARIGIRGITALRRPAARIGPRFSQ